MVRWLGCKVTSPPSDQPLDSDRYLDALAATRRAKALETYPGDLVVFSSRDYDVPRDLWEGVAERVTWEPLPLDHETMFQGDQGAIFASRLSESLRAATAEA